MKALETQCVDRAGKKEWPWLAALLVSLYLIYGGFTYAMIPNGGAIYIPFWHAPWKRLCQSYDCYVPSEKEVLW